MPFNASSKKDLRVLFCLLVAGARTDGVAIARFADQRARHACRATVLCASGRETSVQTPPGGMTMRSNGRPPAVFWFWAHAVVLSRRLDCGAGPSRCR
jgi:hypothetical protein